ncbi:Transposon, En/Spm-like protein [Corchorus capsularis]|uniref:Transposon, En/Spm-like protein n=1 Tax=Corchorus capsularis TaxID=210143 RepID=A0A1R3HI73_COCAP|nr:Transposon, En/Spm-like protein [Corchorus capsularis]
MYERLDHFGYVSSEFERGVKEFVDYAFRHSSFVFDNTIRCPCLTCANREFHGEDVVMYHLYSKGFTSGYWVWSSHGESLPSNPNIGESSRNINDISNPYQRMIIDGVGDFGFDGNEMNYETVEESPNPRAAKFFSLLKDADEALWEGCKKHSKLSVVSQLLNCKSECNMSDASFDRLVGIVKDMMPEDKKLPKNFYRTKKMMARLGLGYEKIHACQNNYMLFYKESESLTECSVCGHPRYKPRKSSSKRQKAIPYKVLCYLPLTPRLQRLFMSNKTAKHMTWHAFNRSHEGELRHPVDGEAWQHFNRTHPEFASDARNVRLGLCSDGFSPFGSNAKPYSCWPVIITVYNLPPWMCMKQPYLFLNMIIPGPNSPGKHIDVFLRPLIDELNDLWNVGVQTFDAYRKQNFQLHAALLWTINDFPAYGMLSGWSTHGRLSCPYCMERTKAFNLENGGKPSFFDCHRQFLPLDHPYRKQRDKFRMGVEKDVSVERLSGEEVFARDKYTSSLKEKHGAESYVQVQFDPKAWTDVIGKRSRSHLYGFGSLEGQRVLLRGSSSQRPTVPKTQNHQNQVTEQMLAAALSNILPGMLSNILPGMLASMSNSPNANQSGDNVVLPSPQHDSEATESEDGNDGENGDGMNMG